ncbi:glycosyltransferase [Enterococcus casseliflavus]|uniref:glycosyltransferase n=1 Tax=Enterococcus casseliflavus TaxID=37734 RepID=UPI0022589448|nr:glycosyltransferase [Enterococcus casseliflavus]MCX4167986.1 glycosyltransferase [Enterococcus casseliflavus]
MKKALITVHLGRHFKKFGHYDYQVLLDLGYEVHIASNFKDDLDHFFDDRVIKHQVDFQRNPFSFKNIVAYKQLKLLLNSNSYDLIHTQSPSGGVVTRIAHMNSSNKHKSKLLYTPHGYHFYKGSPKYYWYIFYNIEKFLLKVTDFVITINEEDYNITIGRMGCKTNKVYKIPGVGVDTNKFTPVNNYEKLSLRRKYGFEENDFLLISIGEFITRKNQIELIRSLESNKNDQIKMLLIGTGRNEESLKKLVMEKNLSNKIIFLGQRSDIRELLQLADIIISSSKQEGLPLSILEGMATGLPIVVSDSRGNRDLVKNNGWIYKNGTEDSLIKLVTILKNDKRKYLEFSQNSRKNSLDYSLENVQKIMKKIYSEIY